MHYTDDAGHKAISSQKDWTFKASRPPGDNKLGAYFTTLTPDANRFSARTRIPREKQKNVFAFTGREGLRPKEGRKGDYILWTPKDYVVERTEDPKTDRQRYDGPTEKLP
jgi:hypothetical protein